LEYIFFYSICVTNIQLTKQYTTRRTRTRYIDVLNISVRLHLIRYLIERKLGEKNTGII